jgi:hypothetical protein
MHPIELCLTIKKGGKNHFYINRGAEDKMNGGRLVEKEPWLPEPITPLSRRSAVRALVARLAVAAACIRVPEG